MYVDVETDWWDWVATVQLFIGIFLPAYENRRKERQYFQEEGSFSQRVVVTLNCLTNVQPTDENGEVMNVVGCVQGNDTVTCVPVVGHPHKPMIYLPCVFTLWIPQEVKR
jgi:hypothetical protein